MSFHGLIQNKADAFLFGPYNAHVLLYDLFFEKFVERVYEKLMENFLRSFNCPIAKFVWSLVATVVRARRRPSTMEQFRLWVNSVMPRGGKFHMVGLAAICWSIWRSRNNVFFEKKKLSDTQLRSFAWPPLLSRRWLFILARGAPAEDTGMVLLY